MKIFIIILLTFIGQNLFSAEAKQELLRKPAESNSVTMKSSSEYAILTDRIKADQTVLSSKSYCEVSRNTTSNAKGIMKGVFILTIKCEDYHLSAELKPEWNSGFEKIRIAAIDALIKIGFKFDGCMEQQRDEYGQGNITFVVCSLSK